jgi:hypothetical protein
MTVCECLLAYLLGPLFGFDVVVLGIMLWHYSTCTTCHRAKKACDRTEDKPCSRCVLYSKKCCVRRPRGWVGKRVKTKCGGDSSARGTAKTKNVCVGTNVKIEGDGESLATTKKSAAKPKPKPKPKSKPKPKPKSKPKPKPKPQDDLGESVPNDILDFMPARDIKPVSPSMAPIVPKIEHMSAGERAYASYCDALDLDIMTMLPTSVRATSVGMDLLDFVFGQGL